jgi:hypothetical protein
MKFIGLILTASIIALHWFGLSWNHIVIISCFGASIFFGSLVIADDGEDKKELIYNDFGKPAKELPGDKAG